MMTLDEAIKHCEEVAEKNKNEAQMWHKQTKGRIVDFCDKAMQEENNCIECAKDHEQLAEWLKELKQLREQEPILSKIKAEIGMYEADCRLQGGTDECEKCNSNIFESIYRIIDKYKAESEDKQ